MAKKRYMPERIVMLLQQIEVGIAMARQRRKRAKWLRSPSRPIAVGGKSTAG